VQHLGRWHLHGIDQDAGEPRTFLLSRIVDAVQSTGTTFEPDGTDFATHALDELERIWAENVAEIEVVPDTDAATRLGKRYGTQSPGETRLSVHYSDINILADELAGYGPEVLVHSPDTLRDRVLERLRQTISAHRDEPGDDNG
jgi:proteasome accessory factor B